MNEKEKQDMIEDKQKDILDEKKHIQDSASKSGTENTFYEGGKSSDGLNSNSQSSISDISSRFLEGKYTRDSLIKHKNSKLRSIPYDEEQYYQEIKVDDNNYITIYGFNINKFYQFLYYICCIMTGGLLYLLLLWVPRWKICFMFRLSSLDSCDWIVVEDKWKEIDILKVNKKGYDNAMFTVFKGFQSVQNIFEAKNEESGIPYLRYIEYRCLRYIYYPPKQMFIPTYSWKDPQYLLPIKDIAKGLSTCEKNEREIIFGKNLIDIEEKSIIRLLIDEIFHYFYIFQIFSIILWMCDTYYYYASCILVITVISIIFSLIKTKKNIRSLRMIARYIVDVRVLRDGAWISVLSSELVPGDIFDLSDVESFVLPCDSILLTGDCIVNESSLTGESIPVSKLYATKNAIESLNDVELDVPKELLKYYLFCGTKIIQVRKPSEDFKQTLAMVVKTGYNTTKGSLIRSMLFQKPPNFKFYRDSLRYVAFMAIIALCGVIVNVVRFVQMGITWNLIILRSLDIVTIVVPPALPVTLAIGTNFAIERLKKRKIYCISPSKVNIAGKIDVMCFDKTGTLTEDGLDVLGIRVVGDFNNKLEEIHKSSETLSFYASNYNNLSPSIKENAMLYTMATCHSLRLLNNELIGDPLDIKMFCFTGWIFEENQEYISTSASFQNYNKNFSQDPNGQIISSIVKPKKDLGANGIKNSNFENISSFELGIIKVFDFVSHLRRMSVVVKEFNSSNIQIYLKGAPEIMKDVCDPNTFPDNYDEVLSYYTRSGFRVIACATKALPDASWVKIQKMKRNDIEKDLIFIGFIIFENRLKPISSSITKLLTDANIRCIMCTGDNILTAISVSRKCNILQDEDLYMAILKGDITSPNAKIIWQNVENPEMFLDSNTLLPQIDLFNVNKFVYYKTHSTKSYSLAITGDIFKWMVKFSPYNALGRMLVKTQVFARMSPDEKYMLVEKLQSLDYCVGFCGDGANDCCALRAANIGISLSETKASIVSSFASKTYDISCVLDLIREGRDALATSFSCFKYMALYSAIQFMSVSILYSSASNLGDFQYLYIDLILVLPIAMFMARSEAYPKLAKKSPIASLVSKKVISSLVGNILILLSFQLVAYFLVRMQEWYQKPLPRSDFFDISNSDNTTLFTFSCYQYILIAVVLTIGPPYRRPIYYNRLFVFIVLISLICVTLILFKPPGFIYDLLELSYIKTNFCIFIVFLATLNYITSWASEKYLFFPIATQICSIVEMLFCRHKVKRKKRYKSILGMLRF